MKVIRVRNVQQALPEALHQLAQVGVRRESRNGPVIMFPEPVTTVYLRPDERVLYWPERDANPFFHLMESLWMLAGRNDVAFVANFVNQIRSYSDDGKTFHGAYGHRWRNHFDFDQLRTIIAALTANPDDRRQVLSMWDARTDLGRQGKDLPCNLQAIFQVAVDGRLDMTVTNRSNDILWGAYGANAVHFSYLHEFVARAIGREQGVYRQVSANFHAYVELYDKMKHLADRAVDPLAPSIDDHDPYEAGDVSPYPLISTPLAQWEEDLEIFLEEGPVMGLRDPFFRRVAAPILRAHEIFRAARGLDRYDGALAALEDCVASDWYLACVHWLDRRRAAYLENLNRSKDDGVDYSERH